MYRVREILMASKVILINTYKNVANIDMYEWREAVRKYSLLHRNY